MPSLPSSTGSAVVATAAALSAGDVDLLSGLAEGTVTAALAVPFASKPSVGQPSVGEPGATTVTAAVGNSANWFVLKTTSSPMVPTLVRLPAGSSSPKNFAFFHSFSRLPGVAEVPW